MAFAIDIYSVVERMDNQNEKNGKIIYDTLMSRHGQHSAFEQYKQFEQINSNIDPKAKSS